ncbi:WcbI family polysaccharide biosynthesis putative acetyltransferase [uncultured Caulobacter sp.]|uniref:WcbI family polysaccharide biosynthesis putative acetyltransferase n=1 Tax=uncultured Caulobacter sp. TaxID=158749 RepID=UPI00262D4458|nr:WcbI family polysaccharide biosynthesis putative acetyltransferase [uncultured Caulobacter sp.]
MSRRKPIRAAIYGACHANALLELLRGVPGLTGKIQFTPIPAVMNITPEEMEAFIASVPDLDVVLYQPISANYRGPQFASARIVEAAPSSTTLISFAYYHFEVYTPFITSALPGLPEPPTEYMDYLLGALIARGFSDETIVERLQHLKGLEPYVEGMVGAAFYEFGVREERVLDGDRPLDIRISDRVRALYQHKRLGHTANHPSVLPMRWIADDILARLEPLIGKTLGARWSLKADPLGDIQFFAAPFVREAFGMTFQDRPTVRTKTHGRQSLAAYVRSQRPFYEAIPREQFIQAVETMAQPTARPWYATLLATD